MALEIEGSNPFAHPFFFIRLLLLRCSTRDHVAEIFRSNQGANMVSLRIEILPGLSEIFARSPQVATGDSPWRATAGHLILEEEVPDGATVRGLLGQLAATYEDFDQFVFDPLTQTLSGKVRIIYNDLLLELQNGLDTKIQEGDTMILLPAFAGG